MPCEIGGVAGGGEGAGRDKAQSSPTQGCSQFLEKQRKMGTHSSPPGMVRGCPAEQQAARSPRGPHQRKGTGGRGQPWWEVGGPYGAYTQSWVRGQV